MIWTEHRNECAHDATGGVELAAVLALGRGELGEEIFVNAAQDVFGAVGGVEEEDAGLTVMMGLFDDLLEEVAGTDSLVFLEGDTNGFGLFEGALEAFGAGIGVTVPFDSCRAWMVLADSKRSALYAGSIAAHASKDFRASSKSGSLPNPYS